MIVFLDELKMRLLSLNKRERTFAVTILILLVYLVFDFSVVGPYLKSSKSHAQAKELITVELNSLKKKRLDLLAELSASNGALSAKERAGGLSGVYSKSELNKWVEKIAISHNQCVSNLSVGRLTPMGGLYKHELSLSGACSWVDLSKLLEDVKNTHGQLSNMKIEGDGEFMLNYSVTYLVLTSEDSSSVISHEGALR